MAIAWIYVLELVQFWFTRLVIKLCDQRVLFQTLNLEYLRCMVSFGSGAGRRRSWLWEEARAYIGTNMEAVQKLENSMI